MLGYSFWFRTRRKKKKIRIQPTSSWLDRLTGKTWIRCTYPLLPTAPLPLPPPRKKGSGGKEGTETTLMHYKARAKGIYPNKCKPVMLYVIPCEEYYTIVEKLHLCLISKTASLFWSPEGWGQVHVYFFIFSPGSLKGYCLGFKSHVHGVSIKTVAETAYWNKNNFEWYSLST